MNSLIQDVRCAWRMMFLPRPWPIAADIQLTRTMREAGKILDIQILGHVIIGSDIDDSMGRGCYSFRKAGSCKSC